MGERRSEIENGNGSLRVKKPRLKWTDDLHQSFLRAVATLGGEDHATPKMIASIMKAEGVTTLNIKSHLQMYRNLRQRHRIQGHSPPRRRQHRLCRFKELIAGNALEDECFLHHPPLILESSNNVFTVHMPGKEGQRPHAYLMFGDILNDASTTQAGHKGKEKIPTEDLHPTMQELREKLVKKCQCNWASSLKLRID